MTPSGWIVAATGQGMIEARLIAGRLESGGIPTRLSYEAAGVIYGVTLDGLGEVKILVPAHLEEEARALLSCAENDEDCPDPPDHPA